MEAEGDVILTGDAAIEALAKHLYDTRAEKYFRKCCVVLCGYYL